MTPSFYKPQEPRYSDVEQCHTVPNHEGSRNYPPQGPTPREMLHYTKVAPTSVSHPFFPSPPFTSPLPLTTRPPSFLIPYPSFPPSPVPSLPLTPPLPLPLLPPSTSLLFPFYPLFAYNHVGMPNG
ncbi:unnamed protein product [Closterium sp. NIES-53]